MISREAKRSLLVRIMLNQMRKPFQVLLCYQLLLIRHRLRLLQQQGQSCQMPPQLHIITLEPLSKFLNGQPQEGSISIFHRREQKVGGADMRIEKLSCIFFPEAEYHEIECEHDFPLKRVSYRSRYSLREWAEYCWIDRVSRIHDCALVLILTILVLLLYIFICVPVYCCKIAQEASREIFVFAFCLELNNQVCWLIGLWVLNAIGAFKVT